MLHGIFIIFQTSCFRPTTEDLTEQVVIEEGVTFGGFIHIIICFLFYLFLQWATILLLPLLLYIYIYIQMFYIYIYIYKCSQPSNGEQNRKKQRQNRWISTRLQKGIKLWNLCAMNLLYSNNTHDTFVIKFLIIYN